MTDPSPKTLTHLNADGHAHMVDVAAKAETKRRAVARATVTLSVEAAQLVREGRAPKGDVLAVARIAGIQAAKRTSELIPLCHPLPLTRATVDLTFANETTIVIDAACETVGRTGVEMEALTAASVAALTLYDMLKAIDRGITFSVELTEKSGGKSGHYLRGAEEGT